MELGCDKNKISCVNDILESIHLEQYKQLFEAEKIDLNMLLDLKEKQFMEMVRDVGIIPWGT